ncbi:MAG: MATE family efflux transporter [Lachnospiraceae bacterium]|nr:MATE family efflux transporter [Lachnospiraceae bacterium]
MKKSKFIGDKQFYNMVLAVAIPIMLQNGITNFVGLLDNIMIGRIGTEQMSGAAIVNQLIFVYNLCIFGGVSGAGIFTAQYYGQKDTEGIRNTFRFKLWLSLIITVATIALFIISGSSLIRMYLEGDPQSAQAISTLMYGRQYMLIMLTGLPAFMLAQVYSSTLRECRETVLPMKAGIISVLVNLLFNYLLIYGKFGFPVLGVRGAAIATALSRYVEVLIIVIWSHNHKEQNPFVDKLYSTLKIPMYLTKKIVIKGTPLLINETLWASGMAMLSQCYSVRGLNVVAGLNISNTINNLFSISFVSLGSAVAIIVGQLLGAGKMEEAKDTANKLIAFSVALCSGLAVIMLLLSPYFPLLYNTNDEARQLAKHFIIITAIFMPQNAFLNAAYFTLRSGGKTVITFLFDSVFIWCVNVTIAFTLSRFTALPVLVIYTMVQFGDMIKCVIGFVLVKKGVWIQNIVG